MKKKKISWGMFPIYTLFIVVCLSILYPLLCVLSVSLTSQQSITEKGFGLWPGHLDFTAYRYIFQDPGMLLNAYGTTLLVALLGTFLGCIFVLLFAYATSRSDFRYRKILNLLLTFTMFFSGGMASQYITFVKILNLKNSLWVLILPGAFSAMNVIIARAYFQKLPYGIVESAKIDGANEYKIFARIMFPLALPAVATICLTLFVGYWNSYYEAMMYMDTGNYVTIQLLLQRMIAKVEFLKQSMGTGLAVNTGDLPGEPMRMAMCVLTVAPMLLVFPRFQKYFVKGMAVGSIKE